METKNVVNNSFYDALHEEWYERSDHPVALLRSENALRNPWIAEMIQELLGKEAKVLDMGCGGGLLTQFLSDLGHQVTGIDLSASSLEVAKKRDLQGRIRYERADAASLPSPNDSFDVVCAMDLLEHVEAPEALIAEASRVLKNGGLFFFHTFNRNLLSRLMIIKGVEWCVKNTPPNLHVYPLFIKPEELGVLCAQHDLEVCCYKGVSPNFRKSAFWKMLFTREVPEDFSFVFTKSLATGYCGFARKAFRKSSKTK